MNNLYKYTFEYQMFNIWNILLVSIKEIKEKNLTTNININHFNLFINLIKNENLKIRKLAFLTLCIKIKFEEYRYYYMNNNKYIYENNILYLIGLNLINKEIKNKINTFYKKNVNKKEIILWYINLNNEIKTIKLNKLKKLIVNEDLNIIFDPKKTISGIFLNDVDLSTKCTISQNKKTFNFKIKNKKSVKKKTEIKIKLDNNNNSKFKSLIKIKKKNN